MNTAAISALAALGGSSVGALGPVLSNWVLQRSATHREIIKNEIAERQTLYSDFITEAARLYAQAMTQNEYSLADIVTLYALVSRIRLNASNPVVVAAEDVVKLIVRRYGDDNATLEEIRKAALSSNADPLHHFSIACRKDLYSLTH